MDQTSSKKAAKKEQHFNDVLNELSGFKTQITGLIKQVKFFLKMFDTNKNVQTVITNKGLIRYLPIFENWDDMYYYSSFIGFKSKEKILKRSKYYIKTRIVSFSFLGIPLPFVSNIEIQVKVNDINKFTTNFFD